MKKTEVRTLRPEDAPMTAFIDGLSGRAVYPFIRDTLKKMEKGILGSQKLAYGIFEDGMLAGYATLMPSVMAESQLFNTAGLLMLTDVFILPDYRKKGYGTQLVKTMLDSNRGTGVWACMSDDRLLEFYEPLGFELADTDIGMIATKNDGFRTVFLVYVEDWGAYYTGSHEKYYDMFNVGFRKYAYCFESAEKAAERIKHLTRAKYSCHMEKARASYVGRWHGGCAVKNEEYDDCERIPAEEENR